MDVDLSSHEHTIDGNEQSFSLNVGIDKVFTIGVAARREPDNIVGTVLLVERIGRF